MALSDLDKQRALAALRGGELTRFEPGPLPEESIQDMGGGIAGDAPPPAAWGITQGSDMGRPAGEIRALGAESTADNVSGDRKEGRENMSMAEDLASGARSELGADAYLLDFPVGPAGRPGVIESGENPAAVGGRRGQERMSQAFDTAPTLGQEAIQEGANVQEREGRDLENMYRGEQERSAGVQAFVQQRRMADEAGELQRQADLDKQVKDYSQNLSDRKAFWKNPGNIISAIAFSLMPFASDDKSIGIKLLNNAIASDFKQRKDLADMHLGELRSNLAGYRQIAKDKQTGDLLAQAEAYRIAAMEVQRIAASYQGPKAQAAAKALTADLIGRSNMTAMQAYRQMVYMPPTQMSPQMRQAYRGQPGFESFSKGAPPRNSPTLREITDEQGNVIDYQIVPPVTAPQGASPGAASVSRATPSGPTGSQYEGFFKRPGVQQPKSQSEAILDEIDSRSPGMKALMRDFKDNLTLWATSQVRDPQLNPQAVKIKRAEKLAAIKQETDKLAERANPKAAKWAGTSMFQKDIADLEAAFDGDANKINAFLGELRTKGYPGETAINNFLIKQGIGADKAQRVREASQRFSQVMNRNINDYYRNISGGAVSESEQTRLERVISQNSPFQAIKAFANDLSREQAGELRASLAGADALAQQYYMMRIGQRYPTLNNQGKK